MNTMQTHRRYAFFDLDGTLIADTSIVSFYRYFLQAEHGHEVQARGAVILRAVNEKKQAGIERDELNSWFYQSYFAGLKLARLRTLAAEWLEARLQDPAFFFPSMTAYVQAYREKGIGTVLVTGSFREVAQPLANLLGMTAYLCAPLEESGGRYTGYMTGEPMIGAGKAAAVRNFAIRHHAALEACSGYGDDHTDIAFLSELGSASVLSNGSARLLSHAANLGWNVIDPYVPALAIS